MTEFYDLSGGMESAAMVWLEANRIRQRGAIVRYADTGKQFPEMADSLAQIESITGLPIVRIAPRITFEEFLFERGGMIRKGTTDCSRRMKRGNLSKHMKGFDRPYTVNLGFNAGEVQRMEEFVDRNERDWLHWRFPLIEHGITRAMTVEICKDAGFSILVGMYETMGRFDCYFCGNQKPSQAAKVIERYPELAAEWIELERRKGHSFMPIPLSVLADKEADDRWSTGIGCACFGGSESVADEIEAELAG